jgi:nucleoside diphosphate kinase
MVKCWLVDDMAEESAIAAVLEGNESQKVWTARGAMLPNRAAPGTIRAFVPVNGSANDQRKRVFKLIHAAGPAESRWEQSG